MKKSSAKIGKSQGLHFHPFVSVIALFLGILGTLFVTHVLAQTTSQQMYACAQTGTGLMRYVTNTTSCRKDETLLTWNIQGPQGVPGSSGSSNGLPYICRMNCYYTGLSDKFKGKDFSGAQFENAHFGTGSDMSGVIFKGGYLRSTDMFNINLTNADFSDIKDETDNNWDQVENVYFNGSNLTGANFSNSQFRSSYFNNTNLQNTNFSNATLSYDNFSGAQNMGTANITGVTWNSVTCPDGSNSDNDGHTCFGHF